MRGLIPLLFLSCVASHAQDSANTLPAMCFSEACSGPWHEFASLGEIGWYCEDRTRFCWTEGDGQACACSTKQPPSGWVAAGDAIGVHGQEETVSSATEYTSIGITRDQIHILLTQEGLNPTYNEFPTLDGDLHHTTATVWNPYIQIAMYGPDDALNGVELTLQPSSNENDAYWQGFISLWLLTAVFPNWDNREEWLNRTIRAFSTGNPSDKIEFDRDGRRVEVAMSSGYFFLGISGVENTN